MPEEIKQDVVLRTQKYLGKYVKKPPLTDKLLKKPPFRFLHDVVNTVIKETGFLKGLFTDEELNSENVKEKDAKVAFLTKLIDAVKTVTSTDLAVRPSKIVAGLEPTETNLLLQAIGKAIDKKIDSSEYISQLQSGKIINSEKTKKAKKPVDKNEKSKKPVKTTPSNEEKNRVTPKNNERRPSNETPKSTDRTKTKTTLKESKTKVVSDDVLSKHKDKTKKREKLKVTTTTESAENLDKTNLNTSTEIHDRNEKNKTETINTELSETLNTDIKSSRSVQDEETIKTIADSPKFGKTEESPATIEIQKNEDSEVRKRSTSSASRPKSARPKSGDIKEKPNGEDNNKELIQVPNRPKSSLRPPSVRPSSARPGAPRLRPDSGFPIKEVVPMGKINVIVESFDKDDDEETVIIQNNPETIEEHTENIEVPADNKGHLVEQILEQITENDGNKVKTESDWRNDEFYGKDTTTKETNNLKSLIQSLTKTANPLGKLLNYLHEDIDAMHAELESWTNTKRQLFEEITKQKKVSTEMNKPLVSQLDHLTQEIKKIEEEISITRNNILRNDLKIKELLSK